MKNMKKLWAALLALAMTFSLAACGGTSDEDAATDDQPTGEEVSGDTAPESDVAYVQDKGTLVVGITYFAPMDYKEEGSDEWIGFDADLAKLFAESLGVSVEFQEITWDYKVEELNSRAIDCVWNGMTLTEDVVAAMGTSDAAVIDVLMAAEMTGEGTSYADLVYSLNLNEAQDLPSEEYGVGFRQGSDLVDAFNTFLAEKTADGTVLEVATTYGLQDAVILE